ncbi:MAG: sulfatase-like hydrolase/transferase [Gammaproteobacteria bacterium]|nr:sulfatase-like hydrolase/transferase [Gammaproteobacteria bacterium]
MSYRSKITRILWLGVACLLAACSSEQPERPNFLIILADDMGYSDIGVMGSEIRTPNIDRLAASGLLMTHFRVHMMCSPTRAMLLTGADSHLAGYGTMAGEFTPALRGQPGYETYLTDRVTTIASVLRDDGYHTYIAGKWDMGGHGNPTLWPDKRGFEESYVLVEGSGSHYDNSPSLLELATVTYVENGKEIELPDDFYSSRNYADKIIEYIDRHKADGSPFLAYLPFTAPHYPLQAPDEFIERYAGVYEQGYEAVRAERIERLRAVGLLGAQDAVAAPHPAVPGWDDLDATMRSLEARRMQVYAAMTEAMDFHIGRVLDYLEQAQLADNTLVIFLSDNGAEGGNPLDFYGQPGFDWAEDNFDVSLANLGRPDSYAWLGYGWAHVGSTPLRYFKGFPTEGGIRTPAIFSFPDRIAAGTVSAAPAHVLDLPVTLLDYAGVTHPGVADNGDPMPALTGRSMRPFLAGASAQVHPPQDYYAYVMMGRRGVVQGDWKITWMNEPWGPQGRWSLFNLADDPAERHDLALSHPDKLDEMRALWDEYVATNNVIPIPGYETGWTNRFSHYQWLPPELR